MGKSHLPSALFSFANCLHFHLQKDDLVCLADYCDIFRCDVLIHKRDKQKKQNLIDLLSFGHEEATKCDPEKMVRLEKSCRNVVRQCTLSLEANVSAEQFAQVEQELIGSLCSFLTCDHYNDDLFTDESAVSGGASVAHNTHTQSPPDSSISAVSLLRMSVSLFALSPAVTQSANHFVFPSGNHSRLWILPLLPSHLEICSVCLDYATLNLSLNALLICLFSF